MKKTIIISLLLIFLGGGIFIYYNYNKPHRTVSNEAAVFTLSSGELFKSFDENEAEANKKYLNKAIEVSGQVGEVTKDQKGLPLIILKGQQDDFGVSCTFRDDHIEEAAQIKKGSMVKVKGICNGGGGLMDVGMTACEIEK